MAHSVEYSVCQYSSNVINDTALFAELSIEIIFYPLKYVMWFIYYCNLLLLRNVFFLDGINKNVSMANPSRTLLRYLITYHYNLISLLTSNANQKNSCIRR